MGQKVNPIGFRLGVNKDWESKWFAGKDYAKTLNKDIKIREYLEKKLKDAAVASIQIARKKTRVDVTINTAKPGVIIGRGGEDIEKLRGEIKKLVQEDVYINIVEVKNPDLNAKLVAQNIAAQNNNYFTRLLLLSGQKKSLRGIGAGWC